MSAPSGAEPCALCRCPEDLSPGRQAQHDVPGGSGSKLPKPAERQEVRGFLRSGLSKHFHVRSLARETSPQPT